MNMSEKIRLCSVLGPDQNDAASAIPPVELRWNRRRPGVHFDSRDISRRRKQVEIERSWKRHLVQKHLHWAGALTRIRAFALAQRVVLRHDAVAIRRDVDR